MEVQKATENEQLFEVRESKSGVFNLIKQNDEIRIVIKNQIVTDKVFNTFEAAEKYINSKPWDLLLVTSYLYNTHIAEMHNLQAKQNNNKN